MKFKLNNKKLAYSYFSSTNLSFFLHWKYLKVKKRILNTSKGLILKNRRILRYLFNNTKISSKKLNNKLTVYYKYYSQSSKKLFYNYLGFVLLNTGFSFNISDVFYLLKTAYIKVNNKTNKSFFTKIKPNDIVTINNLLFFTNFSLFYKTITTKWLKRKRRKISNHFRKYINLNKSNITPSKLIKRWLTNVLWYIYVNNFCEIDYRLGTIFVFHNSFENSTFNRLYANTMSSFSILNLWYYKY